jgi:general stress protein 26
VLDADREPDRGGDTPGIVLIKVKAKRITYWKGREEGEVDL